MNHSMSSTNKKGPIHTKRDHRYTMLPWFLWQTQQCHGTKSQEDSQSGGPRIDSHQFLLDIRERANSMSTTRDVTYMNTLDAPRLRPHPYLPTDDTTRHTIQQVMQALYESPRFLELQRHMVDIGHGCTHWDDTYWHDREETIRTSASASTASGDTWLSDVLQRMFNWW